IGTLSYIDPDSLVFASLGHSITESTSNSPFIIDNGYIYDASINYINKSSNGNIGEIHASFSNEIMGKILNNNINGIYGKYLGNISDLDSFEVAPTCCCFAASATARRAFNA
ncbi:MAG: hypothetical protein II127_03270, partial [Ruminococcus sp.]|nr:hypothetical protein [Ruminococcus sp.]